MNAFNRTAQINTGIAASINRAVTAAFSLAVVGTVGAMTFVQFITLSA